MFSQEHSSLVLLKNQSLVHAARFAVAASAHAVTGYGSQSSDPSRRQIEALIPDLTVKNFQYCSLFLIRNILFHPLGS